VTFTAGEGEGEGDGDEDRRVVVEVAGFGVVVGSVE
jgi:hypothetical protein